MGWLLWGQYEKVGMNAPVWLLLIGLLVSVGCRQAEAEVRPALPAETSVMHAIPPREMSRGPLGRREVALTFDAGGDAEALPALLKVLGHMQVTATFFLTGKWVQRYPQHAKQIAAQNHAIGNHSWAHPQYTKLSAEAMQLDLLAAESMLSRYFRTPIAPLFRAPFGDRDERVLQVLAENGYFSIFWSIDTLDSMEPRKTSAAIVQRVLGRSDADLDGAIILAHVGYPETCEALPMIISQLRARGFGFVTVRKWLGQ